LNIYEHKRLRKEDIVWIVVSMAGVAGVFTFTIAPSLGAAYAVVFGRYGICLWSRGRNNG
jgi:hypothetical protein